MGRKMTHLQYAPDNTGFFTIDEKKQEQCSFFEIPRDRPPKKPKKRRAKSAEEKYRALLMASSEVIYRMSPDWSCMTELIGKDFLADTQKNDPNWLETYIHPLDHPHLNDAIQEAVRTKSVLSLEHRVLQADGSIGWAYSRAVPLLGENGEIIEWIGAASDITKRKEAEAALRQSRDKTLALVKKLRDVNRNKNHFISMLAHELRNPLATIMAGLSVIDISDDRQQIDRAKDTIRRQIGGLTHLVDDLMDMTRISQNKFTIKKEPMELTGLVEQCAQDHEALFMKKGITLLPQICPGPLYVMADTARIRQAVSNLLLNALKFTEQDGKTTLCVSRENGEALLMITDTGIGIDADTIPSIFDPFIQGENARKRDHEGLGIGLALVKTIAILHGGDVAAFSEGPGKGARFTIHLPLLTSTAAR